MRARSARKQILPSVPFEYRSNTDDIDGNKILLFVDRCESLGAKSRAFDLSAHVYASHTHTHALCTHKTDSLNWLPSGRIFFTRSLLALLCNLRTSLSTFPKCGTLKNERQQTGKH